MELSALEGVDGGVLIRVRVQPKASRNAILLDPTGQIRVALTAPPVEGAANTALVKFMAKALGVKRHELALRSGERSRDKTLFLAQGDLQQVRRKIERGQR